MTESTSPLLGTPAVVTDEDGVTYRPWTDGWAVGFQATHPNGRIEYVYLNPSGGSDVGNDPTVFLYQGPDGDPDQDPPVCWVHAFDPPVEPPAEGVKLDPATWRPVHES